VCLAIWHTISNRQGLIGSGHKFLYMLSCSRLCDARNALIFRPSPISRRHSPPAVVMYRIVDFLLSGRISGSGPASRSTIRLRPDSKNRLSGTSLMQACNGHLPLIVRHTVAFCQSAVATKLMIMMMSYTHTQQT